MPAGISPFADPPSIPPGTDRAAVSLRIRHVDSLRAVAAGLVVWSHLGAMLKPITGTDPWWLGFVRRVPSALDLGRVGVMIFFAISGFVICRSFGGPRAGAGRRFVIKRFCRLYPAFWVSLLGGMLVWWLTGEKWNWALLPANATMAPMLLFHQRPLLGVYWTLEVEMVFYAACLGLFLVRWLDRPVVLTVASLFLAAMPRLLKLMDRGAGTHVALDPGKPTFVLALAVMLWGALLRLVYDATGGFRRGPWNQPATWLLALLTLALADVPDPHLKWALLGMRPGPVPAQITVVIALAVFALWVAWWRVDNPVVTYLGTISFSLYLFHPVVKYTCVSLLKASPTLRGWQLPLAVYVAACAAVSVVLAAGVYRWVERPAIALGKRWAGGNFTRVLPANTCDQDTVNSSERRSA